MNDYLRESLSYFGIYRKLRTLEKIVTPAYVSFGPDKDQYFLYYEPPKALSDKIIVWAHGGGWNAGDPKYFDYVGQCFVREGYRAVSLGYRLSPKYKYPCQIEDVCRGFTAACGYLRDRGVDTSKLVVAGPSAGAHLTAILCYSREDQDRYGVDISPVKGFIGSGGPYSFQVDQTRTIRILENMLFAKGYDRSKAEPVSLMGGSSIPMLLIQSRHDGLVEYACAEKMREKAQSLGIPCELYDVVDAKNTHSWYTAGMFMETRQENKGLDKFFSWTEAL